MNNLKSLTKYILFILLFCLASWIAFNLTLMKSLEQKKEDAQNDFDEKKEEMTFLNARSVKKPKENGDFKREYQKKLKELEELRKNLQSSHKPKLSQFKSAEYHKLNGEIVEIAVQQGLDVKSFETTLEQDKKEHKHQLVLEGNFLDFKSFIKQVKTLQYRVTMRSLEIKKNNENSRLSMTMEFNL